MNSTNYKRISSPKNEVHENNLFENLKENKIDSYIGVYAIYKDRASSQNGLIVKTLLPRDSISTKSCVDFVLAP